MPTGTVHPTRSPCLKPPVEKNVSTAIPPADNPSAAQATTSGPGLTERFAARQRHLVPLLALTFSTGIVDAVGYLGLDRVFTGNMTGNVVILGMALAGADGLPIVGPTIALGAFLLGAALGGRVLRSAPADWVDATTWLIAVVGLGQLGLALFVALDPDPSHTAALAVTGVLGLMMGTQAGAARHVGVKDVTTVVVTSTITGLAADSILGNGTGAQLGRRGTAVLAILCGAALGALLLRSGLQWGLLASGGVTVLVAISVEVGRRRSG